MAEYFCRPGREPEAATQAGAHPGEHPTLARSDQALTTEVLCHVPSASLAIHQVSPTVGTSVGPHGQAASLGMAAVGVAGRRTPTSSEHHCSCRISKDGRVSL